MATSTSNRVIVVKDTIRSLVEQHFSSTLGREPDIVNIVAALVMHESSFNVNSLKANPFSSGWFRSYLNSSAIRSKLSNSPTPTEIANINKGVYAVGLMQVLYIYFVKGASPTGVAELQRARPDISGPLLINPGEDLFPKVLGEQNIRNAIMAGLIILESKYSWVRPTGNGFFYIKNDPFNRKFVSKIQGAVSAYLGLAAKDSNGTTPESYASAILGGPFYVAANGKGSLKVRDSTINVASAIGPSTNGSNLATIPTKGCG